MAEIPTTPTPADVARVEGLLALAAAATDGPWYHCAEAMWACVTSQPGGHGLGLLSANGGYVHGKRVDVVANARFAAESREALPAVCRDLLAAWEEAGRLRAMLPDHAGQGDRDAQARAWSAAWKALVEAGLLSFIGQLGECGMERVVGFVRHLAAERERLRADNALTRESLRLYRRLCDDHGCPEGQSQHEWLEGMLKENATLRASLDLTNRLHAGNEAELLRRAAELEGERDRLQAVLDQWGITINENGTSSQVWQGRPTV